MKTDNILPKDGWVNYIPNVLNQAFAAQYFETLLSLISWAPDEVNIYGKLIQTRRKYAWYGDHAFNYSYSKSVRIARPWIPELLEIRRQIEEISKSTFNCSS